MSGSVSYPSHAMSVVPLTPWKAFDKLWTSVMGYHADEFQFIEGETPFSTLTATVVTIVLYYVVILGGREVMRNRPAYQLKSLFMAHNLGLTIVSASLLLLFAGQIIPSLWKAGLYDTICTGAGWTRPLVTLYYVRFNSITSVELY